MDMIAILGGAFDPVHRGHMEMADIVLESGLADRVLLMPCYSHNFGKDMTPPKHRLAMCRLCEKDGVVMDPFEVKNQISGGTLSLVTALELEREGTRPTFIIGADNAACFRKWHKHEELLIRARFIVVPREGTEITHEVRKMFGAPHHILDRGVATISSTQIRREIVNWWANRLDGYSMPENLLPPGVVDYIVKHRLYRS